MKFPNDQKILPRKNRVKFLISGLFFLGLENIDIKTETEADIPIIKLVVCIMQLHFIYSESRYEKYFSYLLSL